MNSYLLLIRGPKAQGKPTPEQLHQGMAKYQAWIETLRQQGVYKTSAPLEDESKQLSGPDGSTITDGPFVESKELVGGFFLIDANNLDHAMTIAKGCPAFGHGASVEVRQLAFAPNH